MAPLPSLLIIATEVVPLVNITELSFVVKTTVKSSVSSAIPSKRTVICTHMVMFDPEEKINPSLMLM